MAANQAVCSTFALNVYQDNNIKPIPDGYQLLCDCPPEMQQDNYFGQAYYSTSSIGSGIVEVVIAHRGTELNFGNIVDDLLLALKIAPEAYELSSKPFTDYVEKLIRTKFPSSNFIFVHTGHSLGAIHAELCTAYQYPKVRIIDAVVCISFESPGSKPIINALVEKGELNKNLYMLPFLITTENADVNVITCCNEHITQPNMCPVGYDIGTLKSFPIDKLDWVLKFSLDQHKMIKMYNYWHRTEKNPNIEVKKSTWPVGFDAGYQYYKTYSNHPLYWDSVLTKYWDDNPDLQSAYNGDYGKYYQELKNEYFGEGKKPLVHSNALSQFGVFNNDSAELISDFVMIQKNSVHEEPNVSQCSIV